MSDERILTEDQEEILSSLRKYEQENGLFKNGSTQTSSPLQSVSSQSSSATVQAQSTGGDEVDGRLMRSAPSNSSSVPSEATSVTSNEPDEQSSSQPPTGDGRDTSFSSAKSSVDDSDLVEPGGAINVPIKADGMYTSDYFVTYNL